LEQEQQYIHLNTNITMIHLGEGNVVIFIARKVLI